MSSLDSESMKYIKLILGIVFLSLAVLQLNDPDPMLWIFIYGVVAFLFIVGAFQRLSRELLIACVIGLISYSLFYLPGLFEWVNEGQSHELVESMKAEKSYIEESREFLGLLIAVAGLIFLLFKRKPSLK